VGRTTNTTRTDFQMWSNVIKRLVEHSHRLLLRLLTHLIKRAVDNAFRNGLLAVKHDSVHELADYKITKLWIRIDLALFCTVTSGHLLRLSPSRPGANAQAA